MVPIILRFWMCLPVFCWTNYHGEGWYFPSLDQTTWTKWLNHRGVEGKWIWFRAKLWTVKWINDPKAFRQVPDPGSNFATPESSGLPVESSCRCTIQYTIWADPNYTWGLAILADSLRFSVNNILAGLWINCISSVEITLFLLADILLQHRALFQC